MSTMVPMAIAIPERATTLASTWEIFMAMKQISTARGRRPEIRNELRRWRTITSTTIMVMRISSASASLSVPRVSRMSPDRS